MSSQPCTPPPTAPPNGPSDWSDAVQGNCFSNIQRLGQWNGGQTTIVPRGTNPSSYFDPVTPGSLGVGVNPPSIYVVIHGWAPGYRAAVNAQNGNLLWWGAQASANGLWSSDWAWSPVIAPSLVVNATGLLQSIVALDGSAVVLAYSWIDDSATDPIDLFTLDEVYRSEAYAHLNGIRLANALELAISPTFWNAQAGVLRLIGHSHGSKVATVAALTLQNQGRNVGNLAILDSPESDTALLANAANLLGFYLEWIQIADPSSSSGGVFVDNYASYFGVGYIGTPSLQNNIVEVALDPSQLYDLDDPSDQHAYAAAWYGGAAAGALAQGEPALGLAWPPFPQSYLPALTQNWSTGTNQLNQWNLATGPSIQDVFSYSTQPLGVTTVAMQGVSGDPSTGLTFAPDAPNYSIFEGSYDNSGNYDAYGIAFDMVWTAPGMGDYMVVTMDSFDFCEQEVLLVMDGQSYPLETTTSVAINSAVPSSSCTTSIYIYFLAAPSTSGQVNVLSVSNFRFVEVGSPGGFLRAKRAAEAQRLKKRLGGRPRREA